MELFRKSKSAHGFTLIELLIVIVIISILVGIGLASFQTARRSARDAQRQSDLTNIGGALEQYYSDNNKYPETNGGKIECSGSTKTFGTDAFSCGSPSLKYMTQLPNDPLSSSGHSSYYYESCGTGDQAYTLFADLERAPSPPLAIAQSCPISGYNYWVNSQ